MQSDGQPVGHNLSAVAVGSCRVGDVRVLAAALDFRRLGSLNLGFRPRLEASPALCIGGEG